MKFKYYIFPLLAVGLVALCPELAMASVESTLANIQDKLVSTILPLAAILGLVFAGFSFVMGSPSARSHLILAIIGAFIGFGAQSIVALIRSLVN
ncbi:MAG: TrbC/VirB2 family protein [Bdellovibrio sp.]